MKYLIYEDSIKFIVKTTLIDIYDINQSRSLLHLYMQLSYIQVYIYL